MGTFNMDARPWSGVLWEFADVIAAVETADVLAPPDRFHDPDNPAARPPLRDRIDARLRQSLGLAVPRMPVTPVTGDYDIAIYICQFVYEIPEILRFHRWRGRVRHAAIYLLESWPSTFASQARALRALDAFDHVFVLNGSAVPALSRWTSTPVSQLSTATDQLRATPVPLHPARVVDLCCIGRNDPQVHDRLLRLARDRGWFYLHDVWRNQNVRAGWDRVRNHNAEIYRRCRYALVWDPAHGRARRPQAEGGDQVLTTRYFEAAAGGAVILGSAPDCPEYHAAFDWPDAVIPLSGDAGPLIRALDRDPARLARIRADNLRQSLLRHDWTHRWAQVLQTFHLAPTPAHDARRARLDALAALVPELAPELAPDMALPEPRLGPPIDHHPQEPARHPQQQVRRHPHQPPELAE
jgi:hypothetical protein